MSTSTPKKILIVDDSPLIHTLLRKVLEKIGHEIIGTAKNGKEGLTLFEKLSPDITFMDINMPVMDGLEAVKQIKERKSDAKIIMLTAVGDEETIKKAATLGVNIFLNKPFNDYKIISALSQI